MKRVVRLTESDLIKIIEQAIESNKYDSVKFRRRLSLIDSNINELIKIARNDLKHEFFESTNEYITQMVHVIMSILWERYGHTDGFWHQHENDIIEYIYLNYSGLMY